LSKQINKQKDGQTPTLRKQQNSTTKKYKRQKNK